MGNLSREGGSPRREIARSVLVLLMLAAAVWAVIAIFYQAGVDAGAHPHKYSYIWWYDWVVLAAAPILIGCVVIAFLAVMGKLSDPPRSPDGTA